MADYYPLLARALEGLADNTPEGRREIYDRARAALGTQLRSLQPPLSAEALEREDASLEAAIARVETVHGAGPLPAAPPDPPRAPEGGADDVVPDAAGKPPAIRRGGRRGRSLLTAAALVVVIAPIAVLAFLWRDTPGTATAPTSSPPVVAAPAARSGEAKFADRVDGVSAPAARPSAAPPRVTAPSAIQPAPAQIGQPAAEPTPAARAPAPAAVKAPEPAVGAAQIAVGQRAMMGEQNPADPQNPILTSGRAVWQLDTVNAGQGQPLQTVVRAKVEIPESALSVDLTLQRNTDPALPSSHTIQVVFSSSRTADDNRIVRDMTPPLMRSDDNSRAVQLSGLSAPVKDNVFLVLLSGLRSEEERNEEFLLRRNWFDLQIRFASGRRANLSFEKGVSGERVLEEAFRQWAQQR